MHGDHASPALLPYLHSIFHFHYPRRRFGKAGKSPPVKLLPKNRLRGNRLRGNRLWGNRLGEIASGNPSLGKSSLENLSLGKSILGPSGAVLGRSAEEPTQPSDNVTETLKCKEGLLSERDF